MGETTDMKTRTRIFISIIGATTILTVHPTQAEGQTSYNDVLIVINRNSPISEQVGAYFASIRGVPPVNIARISVSANEEIDSTEFNSLRSQVENHITSNGLTNQINYIVTTKGVPLKVNRGNTFSTSSPSSSVESELALILGPYAGSIGGNGIVFSPYYYANAHFSRSAYGFYLVTRLDGYTYEDIKGIIDRGGPGQSFSSTGTRFVFDQDPDWNSTLPGLNNAMASAQSILVNRGLGSLLDQTTTYLTNQPSVIGYVSWGSNDHYAGLYTQYAKPGNTWAPGAIVETYVSTSGRTFTQPATYGQSLIADWIAEGATGAKGYVFEPFSFAMAIVSVLFDRYTNNYNLAESYYMASRSLSWMDVVVGDPKTSLNAVQVPNPVELAWFTAEMNGLAAELKWGTVSETNNYGFEVQRKADGESDFTTIPGSFVPGHGTTLTPQSYSFVDRNPPSGKVYYRLKQIDLDGTFEYHGPIAIVIPESSKKAKVYLAQNYPNPFNPSTNIQFVLPTPDHVVLRVYNTAGQEVATLIDGPREAGVHSAKFDAGHLASGVYFYVLKTSEMTIAQKMILVK